MKIRKIEFINHKVFGNLNLDFTDENRKTINTIIIAGENGVGKSLLLNTIFEFSNLTLSQNERDEKRIFEIEFNNEELEFLKVGEQSKQYFTTNYKDNIFKISIDYNIIKSWKQVDISGKTETGFNPPFNVNIFSNGNTYNVLKTLFSDTEINFKTRNITTVTTKNIDIKDISSQRSNPNLATEIAQLLIDIESLDALELKEWVKNNVGQPVDEDKIDVRIKRFTSAFHTIFPSKKYKRIENRNDKKEIIFEENGNEMSINDLSSGEKQIVFRGSFLLKDKESSKGSLILIDEPEISLHPKWQLDILSFFKKLFTNNSGEQTSQIIVSTHSPFIIHNANRYDDKVIILEKDKDGKISVPDEAKFFGWSNESLVQKAFDINYFLTDNKTMVLLEGETDEKYFNKCLEVFDKTHLPIEFKWIGIKDEKGNAKDTGRTALDNAKRFILSNPYILKNKIILLYDPEEKIIDEISGNLSITKLNFNNDNLIIKIGIENLLTIDKLVDLKHFYKERINYDGYGAKRIIEDFDKVNLCNYICNKLDINTQQLVLKNLDIEIDRLLS